MKQTKGFDKVISILKKDMKKYTNPSVTQISNTSKDPFKVMISCILSLRTRDQTTLAASERLFKLAGTPEETAKLTTKQIEKAIYPVGFYKTKAVRIKNMCKVLIEKYSSRVPDSMEELLKFKGVGRKTANIVIVYGFHKEGLPIDVHCNRIPNRLGWVKTKTPEQTEEKLRKLLPKKLWLDFNNIFVTFGQNICLPVGPKCFKCPIEKYCKYERKNLRG